MASPWSIAIAIGLSFTHSSDLTINDPATHTQATFKDVSWAGRPFVTPIYYVLRFGKGDIQVDFTHYKIIAATQKTVREDGTWDGQPVGDDVRLDQRIQHFEISHGVNSLALVGIAHDPTKRGLYFGIGPVVYLSHSETTVDNHGFEWGYGPSGQGFEFFGGDGLPAPWAELKMDFGNVTVPIDEKGGTASVPLQTLHISIAP